MNTPLSDRPGLPDLGDLLRDAVDDIEPADRIAAIRARTAHTPARAARPWFYTAGGVALATAAAVTAFVVLGGDRPSTDEGPAHPDHASETVLVPAYYLGETADGWRLFREFDPVVGDDPAAAALERLQRPALDPDYESPWPRGSFEGARLADGVIEVELGDAAPDLDHPAGDLVDQQVVYTLQGTLHTQAPVQFVRDGDPVGDPIDSRPQNEVLNPVSISDPAEGQAYHGSFTARGRANSFETTVHWEIQAEDRTVVRDGVTNAAGWIDKLYPWQAEIDLTGLPDGSYTFVVREDDPSGGAEGSHPAVDTRTIIVR